MRRPFHVLAFASLGLFLLSPVLAAPPDAPKPGTFNIPKKGPADMAKTPSPGGPIPIPYPNVSFTNTAAPQACKDVDKVRDEVDERRRKLAAAHAQAPTPSSADAVEKANLLAAQSQCCALMTLNGSNPNNPTAGVAPCVGAMMGTKQGRSAPLTYTPKDNVDGCVGVANAAADQAGAAAKASENAVRTASEELRKAELKLADQLKKCAAALAPPAPQTQTPTGAPKGKALGDACSANVDCLSLLCSNGKCSVVAPLNATCDDTHVCGPALECRESKCKVPCACPLTSGCFVENNQCVKNVSATVRKDCPTVNGWCAPPCFRDAGNACKIDTTDVAASKASCAPVCF